MDNRGVTPILGAILLLGIAMMALTMYQINFVPYQNQQAEYNNYLDVEGDMLNVRNAIGSVGEDNPTASARVDLITHYPDRTFLINPPPARSSFQAANLSGGIAVSGVNLTKTCGITNGTTLPSSKLLKFTPDYHYLNTSQVPPMVYENTVLYKQIPGDGVIFMTGQTLIQGETINLLPLTGSMDVATGQYAIVDFVGGVTGRGSVNDNVTVTIPTRLTPAQWTELLEGQNNFKKAVANGSRVDIILEPASYEVACTPVGMGEAPDVNIIGGKRDQINPSAPGDIALAD
ncbi:MAG: hypothetical protein ABEI52_05035, partial [Halobacteriaceae archaeon]